MDSGTLRKVIELIRRMEDAPDVDPYLWGYGTIAVREELQRILSGVDTSAQRPSY